jgi:MinD superfamily P-loop ATPase
MKQIVIISGKGGTGKTVLSACFAALAKNKVMADCDVDAANLHLLLHPIKQEPHPFYGMKKARIDPHRCTACGECAEACRFEAIQEYSNGTFQVDRISCEGCTVCSLICPVEAISMEVNKSGELYVSETSHGPFVHAKLGAGEENSGKLVTEVRKKAKELAENKSMDLVIVDGPPGIGCPVLASLTGTDLALVVTEPTPSGFHDMERVIQVTRHFGIKAACCINKYDLNIRKTNQIQDWCEKYSVPVLGTIPYDESVIQSLVQGVSYIGYADNSTTDAIKKIWVRLDQLIYERNMS